MPFKTYKVNFAVPTVGDPGRPLHRTLAGLHERFGEHWPPADVEGTRYRIRDLVPVGRVWLTPGSTCAALGAARCRTA